MYTRFTQTPVIVFIDRLFVAEVGDGHADGRQRLSVDGYGRPSADVLNAYIHA